MQRQDDIPARPSHTATDALTIRMAAAGDRAALGRLAQLDSARLVAARPVLVAEVGGTLRAALPLDGTETIADPFERTAEIVAILVERARQLQRPAPRERTPWRRALRVPGPAAIRRA